ncbi:RNA 2'-phosphotransferase [Leminorella grimontii]|uniref:RNA 2'-phosphotransferase n=1 Tax=Leminorella grimontii TaxID=82981 RepID=UPI0035A21EB7
MKKEERKIMEKQLTELSKFLSFVLRHKPEAIGMTLDSEGWANVDTLIERAKTSGKTLTPSLIATVVETNAKKRFSLSDDGKRIRAAQGHSTEQVSIAYEEKTPPEFLFHGTASRFIDSIKAKGLIPGSRHYVHLSDNEETAVAVGRRHGSPVLLKVKAGEMHRQGLKFYQADNGVWLTPFVAVAFLE